MPNTRSTPHVHHRVNPRYILRRQMNVDGRFRLPGEEIPEAATWPNLYAYLDLGWIDVLDEDEEDVPTMGVSRPKKEVVDETIKEELVTTPAIETIESEVSKPVAKPRTRSKGEPV